VTFVLPEIVFDERLTLYRGDFEVQLIHFPGHTRGDVVVFLPRQRVLISGDLLDDLPFTGHGSPAALARTLRELEQLDFSHVIPGHGQVRAGKAHLRLVAEMFESIVVHVEAAVAEGKSLENTKQSAELDRFRAMLVTDAASARYWDFFIPEAIARAFEEAGASPEDG
jgi:cyclase